jgi:adenosylcobinamide-GDP ribazoletransferase
MNRNILGSLAIAFSMYSRIPMPQVEWTKERMKYALCFFPLIGAVIGGVVWILALLAGKYEFYWFQKLVLIVVPLLMTGGIHMDGYLDVVDARASHADRERKLEILKDPHTGAFAIIFCGVYLLVYAAACAELNAEYVIVLGGIYVLTRALSGLAVVTFPMAKNSGLAAAFSSQAQKKTVAVTMVFYILGALCYIRFTGGIIISLACMGTAFLTYCYYYRMSKKEFGGITGDLAGYFLQICELVLVITLALL